jgi:hypothetical protein
MLNDGFESELLCLIGVGLIEHPKAVWFHVK